MDKNEMLRRMNSANFSENNGHIMQVVDMICGSSRFEKLSLVRHGVYDISDSDFSYSVGFLASEGYIELRDTAQHKPVDIADAAISNLEVRCSGTGSRLMKDLLHDDAVRT